MIEFLAAHLKRTLNVPVTVGAARAGQQPPYIVVLLASEDASPLPENKHSSPVSDIEIRALRVTSADIFTAMSVFTGAILSEDSSLTLYVASSSFIDSTSISVPVPGGQPHNGFAHIWRVSHARDTNPA